MKRITYALTAMAAASLFCILNGKLGEVLFLSPVFAVILTVFRQKILCSLLIWTVSFYVLLIPVFLHIYPDFFISAIIGHFSYIVIKALEGNLNLVPSKTLIFSVNLPEKALFALSFSVFLGILVYM